MDQQEQSLRVSASTCPRKRIYNVDPLCRDISEDSSDEMGLVQTAEPTLAACVC